jgi:hypothetical protein
MRGNNYFIGFTQPCGFGFMVDIDPPYVAVRKVWAVDIRLFIWKFWYVKPRKQCA